MISISHLYIYPVKSLGGIEVQSAQVHERGFQYDRRWMIVGLDNHCLTQRDVAEMALFSTAIENDRIIIRYKNDDTDKLVLPTSIETGVPVSVTIWDDRCDGLIGDPQYSYWISSKLGIPCKLVYMPDSEKRRVNPKYATGEANFSIANWAQVLP